MNPRCSINNDECTPSKPGRKIRRGLCSLHWRRQHLYGDPHFSQQPNHRRHGHGGSPEHVVWKAMRQRCNNPKSRDWPDYGARGIKVCERWELFENFLADMGPRPGAGYSIDRQDVNGNYELDNCRWATASAQALNKRKLSGTSSRFIGVSWHKRDRLWQAYTMINGVMHHHGRFTDEVQAARARDAFLFERGIDATLNFNLGVDR